MTLSLVHSTMQSNKPKAPRQCEGLFFALYENGSNVRPISMCDVGAWSKR